MTRHARADGEATKRRILEEAEHLIHLQGYRGTSLDEIARRCRMTKANLLHHFKSKEELGLAVLELYEGAIMLARTRRDPSVFDRARDTALDIVRSRPRPKSRR